MPEAERRRSTRHRFEQQVLFKTRDRGAPSVAKVRDASDEGLFIETDRMPRPGLVIAGVVRLDPVGNQRPVSFLGEVVRTNRWRHEDRPHTQGFAVRFVRLSRTGRQRLADALATTEPSNPGLTLRPIAIGF